MLKFIQMTLNKKALELPKDSTELQINHFLQASQIYSFNLEPGYKFNREEIYEREN